MAYKAVIFDMGGVAVRLARHQKFVSLVAQAYKQESLRHTMFDFYEGKLSFEDVVNVTQNVFERAADLTDFERASFAELVGETDANIMRTVRLLRAGGYKVGLLTNNGFWSRKRERSMIIEEAGEFDAVVESCRHGTRKPNPDIFRIMLNELGVRADESVMVDDSPLILETADRLGMGTILVQGQDTAKAVEDLYRLLNGRYVPTYAEVLAGKNWKVRAFA